MSARIFDESGDIKMFFFYFENVAMRYKEEKDYYLELFSYLDGPAFEFYFEKFTNDGSPKTEASDFKAVKEAFVSKF